MSLWGKIRDITRGEANQAYRSITQTAVQQNNVPVLAKVIAIDSENYTVLLPSGETKFAKPVGGRSIGLGDTAHIIGDSLF